MDYRNHSREWRFSQTHTGVSSDQPDDSITNFFQICFRNKLLNILFSLRHQSMFCCSVTVNLCAEYSLCLDSSGLS